MYRIRAASVEEFTFVDTVAVQREVARNGHRATRDVRRTTEGQALWEAAAVPTSQGSKTSGAERLAGAEPDVTMLAISQGSGA